MAMNIGDGQQEEWIYTNSSPDDAYFDLVIGHIEDIIMDPEFQRLQQSCLEKHCGIFEGSSLDGENKLEYTAAFNDYTQFIETHLEETLKKKIPEFSMPQFQHLLGSKRQDELDGEIFELLISFSSFLHFKELMLDYKAAKESRTSNIAEGLLITEPCNPR